jgi:hypothetical protein
MKYADIVHRCFRCGYCKFTSDYENFNCPSYRKYRFDTFARGRMWLIRAGSLERSKTANGFRKFSIPAPPVEAVSNTAPLPSGRIWSTSLSPPGRNGQQRTDSTGCQRYFKAISIHGNPYNLPAAERAACGRKICPSKVTTVRIPILCRLCRVL